jgi:hypothetical protein
LLSAQQKQSQQDEGIQFQQLRLDSIPARSIVVRNEDKNGRGVSPGQPVRMMTRSDKKKTYTDDQMISNLVADFDVGRVPL